MPLTFEELANAGIDETPPESNSAGSLLSRRHRILLGIGIGICIGIGIGIGIGLFLYWQHSAKQTSDPLAAQILLSGNDADSDILPHTKDSSTEFETSFDFLKEDALAPAFRETEAAKMATSPIHITGAADKAPSIQLDSEPLAQEAAVSPQAVSPPMTIPQETIIDWGGMVLVPDGHILAKAYNSDVRILRIEAHPIDGDYIRVWARIQNLTDHSLQTEIGCEFRSQNQTERPHFAAVTLKPKEIVDTYFVSQDSEIHAYTILVKR